MKSFIFLNGICGLFLLTNLGCQNDSQNRVCFSEKCFNVEVVYKEEDVKRGLMHREHMDQDSGMLFAFHRNRIHSFWMKNTLIPLDMIWLDYHRKIVHIETDVPPCKTDQCPLYTPQKKSLFVVEINAGQANASGLKIGDTVDFQLLENALTGPEEKE